MDRNLKKRVLEWRKRVGYTTAKETLMARGFSLSLAQKLLAGTYIYDLKTSKFLTLADILDKK